MPLRWRQIKQEYWADSLLHKKLSAAQREFYIGLWMLADDLGWFRADRETIAAELYRFRPVEEREREVTTSLELLTQLGRIQVHPCGHGFIPKLRDYQHLPAKDKGARTFWRQHQECPGVAAEGEADDGNAPIDMTGPKTLAPPRRRPQNLAGIGKASRGEKIEEQMDDPLKEANSLEGVAAFIQGRWQFEPTQKQREVIAGIADHLAQGSDGFRRIKDILGDSWEPDPIAALIAYDRRLKEEGKASALDQEEESARWRRLSGKRSGEGFTSIDGRTPSSTRKGET